MVIFIPGVTPFKSVTLHKGLIWPRNTGNHLAVLSLVVTFMTKQLLGEHVLGVFCLFLETFKSVAFRSPEILSLYACFSLGIKVVS